MSTSAAQGTTGAGFEYGILDRIIAETSLTPDDEAYGIAKRGVSAFIEELLKPQNQGEQVKKALVDRMIAEIDAKLSQQMDEILHHAEFQALESSWRGLKLLVDRTDFRENIKVEILNVSKQDLLDDFEDSPEVVQSGLYKHIYTAEYGQFGGQPVGAIVANYYFSPSAPDVKTMQYVASVSSMSHAPFISAAGPKFFALDSFTGLPDLKDLKDHFEGPQFAKWQSFREQEDSRYVGLTVPRFLLRNPYDPEDNPVKSFVYKENVANNHEHYRFQLGPTVYPKRDYCTQYDESDLHFVQRLCEEEGIHYHFEHSAQQHLLVFGRAWAADQTHRLAQAHPGKDPKGQGGEPRQELFEWPRCRDADRQPSVQSNELAA